MCRNLFYIIYGFICLGKEYPHFYWMLSPLILPYAYVFSPDCWHLYVVNIKSTIPLLLSVTTSLASHSGHYLQSSFHNIFMCCCVESCLESSGLFPRTIRSLHIRCFISCAGICWMLLDACHTGVYRKFFIHTALPSWPR